MLSTQGKVIYVQKTLQSGATATGNGTALDCSGYSVAAVQIDGITTATITFEATVDGDNWVAVQAENLANGSEGTTATADGLFRLSLFGLAQIRCRISAYTSGTINVTVRAVS